MFTRVQITVSALAVASVAASMTVAAFLAQPPGLPSQARAVATPAEPSARQILERVDALQRRLQEAPDDVEGWKMLGRSLVALGRMREAVAAYSQAAQLRPNDAEVRAALARLMQVARDRRAHEDEANSR